MNQSNMSADDKLRHISDLLKTADRHVLAGEFNKAKEQVDRVFKLDPDNIYAKAYLQRIEVFRNKHGGGEEQDETSSQEEIKPEDIQDHKPEKIDENEAQESTENEAYESTESQSVSPEIHEPNEETENEKEPDRPDPIIEEKTTGDYSQIKRHVPEEKLSIEEQRRIVEEIVSKEADLLEAQPQSMQPPSSGGEPESKSSEDLKQEQNEENYRKTLEDLWKKGSISEGNKQKLKELRASLDISDERHQEIERSVKLAAYVNAVKEAWKDGLITPTSAATLDELRERYDITINEHLMIESRIMYELHGVRTKGVVMVIDDDVELVKIIKSILREEGYAPFSVHNPEQGLKILERTTPDLILLDVTFPKPSMSGFSTYEQIRKRPNLRFVPVIFLSGLDEEHIVQVGKKLGADDYITKPCSEQFLVSTIEGKIKRYKEMRKTFEK